MQEQSASDAWDAFADVYDFATGLFVEDLPSYCSFARTLPKRAWVLELLCGTGRITGAMLSTRNDITVVGADYSDRMLARLSPRLAPRSRRRLQITKGDITDASTYPAELRGRIQMCVLGFSDVQLFPWEKRLQLFRLISGLLVPGGLFLLDDSTRSPEELQRATGQPVVWRGPEAVGNGTLASATCVDFYFPAEGRQRRVLAVDSWPPAGGPVQRTSIQLDYFPLPAYETFGLLRGAGFRKIQLFEDYVAVGEGLDPLQFGKRSGPFVART